MTKKIKFDYMIMHPKTWQGLKLYLDKSCPKAQIYFVNSKEMFAVEKGDKHGL